MAATLLQSRSYLWRFFDSYRLRKFRSHRAAYKAAAVSSDGLGTEARELVQAGLFRAAVFTARLWLEQELCDLGNGLTNTPSTYFGRHWLPLLLEHGRITRAQASRVSAVYNRASKIVHGRACPAGRAKGIVTDVRACIDFLRHDIPTISDRWMERTSDDQVRIDEAIKARKVVAGFATMGPAGVANFVTAGGAT